MSKSSIITEGPTERMTAALQPVHPGEILAEGMADHGLSASALARALNVPPNRVAQILAGRRAVTGDTALRLARYFGTSAEFWIGLQASYDLAVARREHGAEIATTVRPRAA